MLIQLFMIIECQWPGAYKKAYKKWLS